MPEPKRIILATYPIRPSNIDVSRGIWDAFGNRETEDQARLVVLFQQSIEGDHWTEFEQRELERFAVDRFDHDSYNAGFIMSNLVKRGLLTIWPNPIEVLGPDRYIPTHKLISRTFAACPAVALAQV